MTLADLSPKRCMNKALSALAYRRELRTYQRRLSAARGNHQAIRHIIAERRERLHAALGAGR